MITHRQYRKVLAFFLNLIFCLFKTNFKNAFPSRHHKLLYLQSGKVKRQVIWDKADNMPFYDKTLYAFDMKTLYAKEHMISRLLLTLFAF